MKIKLISVIIINKHDRDVDTTLRLLQNQEIDQSFEIIVVDASKGALDDVYAQYSQVRCIPFTTTSTKHVTIPEQRNVGVAAAKGEIIVFIDASCEPGADWLQTLVGPILVDGEMITAGGTLSSDSKTFHDVVYHTQAHQKYLDQAPTINLAIARSVFDTIGYFDENLRYGSDMDLTWRARAAGFNIRNVPDALVTHNWGNLKSELKRANHYGQAKVILYRKHRYGFLRLIRRESTLFIYIGFVLLLPLTFWIPFYPLLILIPILKNLRAHSGNLILINLMTAYGAAKEFIS